MEATAVKNTVAAQVLEMDGHFLFMVRKEHPFKYQFSSETDFSTEEERNVNFVNVNCIKEGGLLWLWNVLPVFAVDLMFLQ